ncbi:SRPBCC domain-containing protein [Kitasatospora sp. NPDC008115]|uniref:SRPBCC family protein n=1 Tax=Kitasatospora sp. NPDC008115 TaxID=3364022 RepID=UPI0036EB5A58
MTESNTINCDKFLPHTPAAVWNALTDPGLHTRWWAAGDIRPVAGHRFTLDMGNFGSQQCEVTEVEPERLLTYRFAEGALDTTVTWRLEAEGSGTHLYLTHTGFDLDSPMGRQAYAGMGNGWPHVLDRLAGLLGETA